MMMIISTVFGFLAPFVPELLKWFRDKDDKKHEIAMYELQMKFAEKEHIMRLAEFEAIADIEEAKVLHKPQKSYGVQLIDAADKWAESTWGKWLVTPAFYLFTLLDFFAGMVRPFITYTAFLFYMWYKWALLNAAGMNVLTIWNENDFAIVMLVLSYWFGHRAAKAAFGGNATNGSRGS